MNIKDSYLMTLVESYDFIKFTFVNRFDVVYVFLFGPLLAKYGDKVYHQLVFNFLALV